MQSDQHRAMWAVILSGIVLFLWQYFFVPKVALTPQVNTAIVNEYTQVPGTTPDVKTAQPADVVAKPAEVQVFKIKNDKYEANISSNLEILNFTSINSEQKMEEIIGDKGKLNFALYTPDKKFIHNATVQAKSDAEILITSPEGINLTVTLDLIGRLHVKGILPKGYGYGINGHSVAHDSSVSKRNFAFYTGKLHTVLVGKEGEESGTLKWVGIDYSHYFVGFVTPDSPASDLNFDTQNNFVSKSFSATENIDSYFVFVKKEYEYLKTLGDNLHQTVDFGFFAFLAVPILWLLKFFYNAFLNYGIAIIALTLLIRLLTFPLQFTSLKGMKKMQVLQPELAKLKIKYKDDPVTMQKETMAVFKRSGVNPLSGCFPLLLQMPIFFALYSVLYNAVELVGADFFGWIHDLSAKDPYYILPVLMAVSMFVQQKITPSTITDKMQQRIFLFMPLIFGFFMKDLPSGLSLYIFVSTLSGILQQVFIFKKLK